MLSPNEEISNLRQMIAGMTCQENVDWTEYLRAKDRLLALLRGSAKGPMR